MTSRADGGHRRTVIALLALSLAVRLLTALLLRQPGYADAYYYAVGAHRLSTGHGFDEPFIWNYLDPPSGVPHPGYLYWMPLTAILGWLGTAILSIAKDLDPFRAVQAPFVLLSALLPLLAYGVAWDLTRKRRHAVLAGLLAVFPGFYTHFLVLPDNVTPFALAGGLCLWAAGRGLRDRQPLWFGLAGLAAGLGHLARADGLLLEFVVLFCTAGLFRPSNAAQPQSKIQNPKSKIAAVVLALAGYLAIMLPWFVRNWQVIGAPLSGAGTATLFLTSYDDIFAYGRPLTLGSYLAWGWGAIARSKAEALLLNLERLWVENLLIFLLPFAALGLWRLRRERLLWPFFLYAPLLFAAMTLAFTFPGMRGGLFHSGGALLPFFFAAAGPGLEAVLRWAALCRMPLAARRRILAPGRAQHLAWQVFSAGMVGLAVLLSVWALWRAGAFVGKDGGGWNEREAGYGQVGQWLAEQGAAGPGAVVMAGDAPGLTWHTGRPAIAVPNEPLDTVLAVADRYGARYLVLDDFRPRTTDALYDGTATHPRLTLRCSSPGQAGQDGGAWQLYEIAPGRP